MPEPGDAFAIAAPKLFDGEATLRDHCVVVRAGLVESVLPVADRPPGTPLQKLESGTLAPGFVDLQVNGGGDILFNNSPDAASLVTVHTAHRSRGTTALLPTLVSDTREVRQKGMAAVIEAHKGGCAGILGIHFEGPWFNESRRGAHSEHRLDTPTADDLQWLCEARDFTVMVTLAPERVAPEFIARLAAAGVHVCAGHTDADYETIVAAAHNGLRGVTHLFNAMSQLASRQPGTVGAALALDALWAGIIADGHHVHPAAIRLAAKAKPAGKLVLVSDAMATVGGSTGSFDIYGETIREQGGRLVNAQGAMAGSAIGLVDAVRYCHREVGLPLEECLRMASLYPAAVIGMDATLGRLRGGHRADIVHLDEALRVRHTWVAGSVAAHDPDGLN
jgi:N-acetylglucosamine-6-phosphate deacetylase